jgi:putative ABC transport system substrate-binding protein
MTTRRELLIALGALASLPAYSQQPTKVWRVGILEPSASNARAHLVEALRQRLRELGYQEGRNLSIDFRFAGGKLETLPLLAAELVRLNIDVIVASTTPAIQAAQKATNTIPIVMSTVGDPIEAGFVVSFAHPGKNITGRTTQAPELMAKRVQLLKEAVPKLTSIAVLLDTRNTHEVLGLREAAAAGKILGVKLRSFEVRGLEQIETAFAAAARDKVDGVMVFENAINNSFQKRIVDLSSKYRLAGIYPFRDFTEDGGLMSFGADIIDNYHQAAVYVDKILKGAKPADLPVEQPTKFEMVVNMKAAKAMGFTIPQSILLRADRVIE